MSEIFASPYFGVALSVIAFGIGVKLNQKFKTPFCNPLIIAIVLVSAVLLIFKIPYEDYNKGGEIINMFLAPATACLAVAVYTKLQILKQYWFPILVGCAAGSAASMGSVYLLCRLFGLDESLTVSLLPKSVTTPIAVSIAEPAGRNLCTASHPTVPCGRSGCGGPCHRGLKSRSGNFQGDRTGRDRRSDERTCHRNLRDHHCIVFDSGAVTGVITGAMTELIADCFERIWL